MTIAITTASASQPLNVPGEQLRPLTRPGSASRVFETTGPEQVGPPPHRHPRDEIYAVLDGMLEVFDGPAWR